MKVNQKKYEVPTVKVVNFMIEHGYAGSFETESQETQTRTDQDGEQPGEIEGYNRVTFDGWGN